MTVLAPTSARGVFLHGCPDAGLHFDLASRSGGQVEILHAHDACHACCGDDCGGHHDWEPADAGHGHDGHECGISLFGNDTVTDGAPGGPELAILFVCPDDIVLAALPSADRPSARPDIRPPDDACHALTSSVQFLI